MNDFVCDALSADYRVAPAYNGREGVERARALHPDVIVCDFMMPEMAGDELVRQVRAEPRMDTTPILVLTARNDSEARIEVLRRGANDYLLKPFYQPELRARVDNLIKVRQAEERLHALDMANDRDRIARDLHDLVIQRVFGVGMRLTAMLNSAPDASAERLREIVAELDGVISDIRTTIFDLQTDPSVRSGLRAGVLQLTVDAGERLGFPPRVRFDGPVDTAVDRGAGEQLLTVLRESLSNVIRHAGASAVEVDVSAGADLVLVVADDGIGPPRPRRRWPTGPTASGCATWRPGPPPSAGPSPSGPTSPRAPWSSGGCPWPPTRRPSPSPQPAPTQAMPPRTRHLQRAFSESRPSHPDRNQVAPESHPSSVTILVEP